MAFHKDKDMDLVEQLHIFGLSNTHSYGSDISLIGLFSLIFNYAKPRLSSYLPCYFFKVSGVITAWSE